MKGQGFHGKDLSADVDVKCDVCIVGSGAGGAMLAAGLVQQGLSVVMLEEGGWHTKADFDLQEGHAFPMLYQERGARATADLAISVLQGRSVGGSTTVNWTTCFRTPERILKHWHDIHHLEGLDAASLAPHFEAVEERLSIAPWPETMANANNKTLLDGCRKLGHQVAPLRRNVKGCVNSGFCSVGCPVDGKQSQLVTTIPEAIEHGMTLYADARAERLEVQGGKVVAVHAVVLDRQTGRATARKVVVRPKVAVSSGGAINGPALLLRSGLNANGRVGLRTFLHPVVAMVGQYAHKVEPYFGAPQSIGSHQFIDRGPDKVGFFLETAPLQPMIASTSFHAFGQQHHQFMAQLPYSAGILALSVDGLLPGDEGGTVTLRDDGRVRLDYPVGPALQESFRVAMREIARIHLAAGAKAVYSLHTDGVTLTSEADLPRLEQAPYGALQHAIFTAHQMGGCSMGVDKATSVVDAKLRHHDVRNLFVVDGSVLPTALGVNPSETIYALAHRARGDVVGAV
jgi:choline dehydrogenase-like flavoprotein